MKQLYTTLLTLLVFTFTASAQVLLYHENFVETNGSIPGVFVEPAGAWVFSNAAPTSTLSQSSKGNYARTSNDVTTNERRLFIDVSTLGYSAATITWEQFRNPFKTSGALTAAVELQYSINGGATRTTFYTTTNNTNNTWNKVNNGAPIALPAAIMGLPTVRLYWRITYAAQNKNETAYYAIDDITITGTPETGISTFDWATRPLDENPFTVSGINAATPYMVDGVTMRWSSSQSAGVAYETSKVDDKSYKTNTKSFTLIQTGASSTSTSVIQLDLNKPIEDLTFTIFDIDVAANQFSDKLVITGYNNGTAVPLVKNKVKTTSYNQFASSTLSGIIASDNASSEGDVTITFSKAVTKVIIQYSNTATIRNASGRQGIAIHNLTWRKEQVIAPLPVELVSFKVANTNGTSVLSWSTASEKDNEKFEVERSVDGKHFSKLGEVAGNGTSSRKLTYTFTDKRPASGKNYYRLRQVDFDGTFAYSKTVTVNFAAPKTGEAIAQVYPTMATTQVTIGLTIAAGPSDITIQDAAGRTIARYAQVTEREQLVPVQGLQAGIYFVTVTNGQVRETYRFLKK
ncbi:T9SS type A sorting domain-containing protein [Pontibacter fetidus]|uniref:T9SS type A sorting domain-containing protein n=1 Tax=Pontibacter fetidus TaxID=2700082 RepID=A0A6B2GY77_9BACT|nr:T9SS type A sorting domain-containing protein [Pontibacter fetidus]NDK54941.1 T9SS type A sorting domain-containing protein [Pontibacter fetidus]